MGEVRGGPAATGVAGGAESVGLRGRLLRPGDGGYDTQVAGFQTAARHRPELVVTAHDSGDVVAAVRHATARGLPVAVQAGGHGLSVAAEGGVLLNTRAMDGVRVDPAAGTAWVRAGTRWDQVIAAAAPHGLAPLSGSAPGVGAVPYTLGGGLGLLARRYGYAADHVCGLELVTADGRVLRVGADDEPDLFWAVRGGRDNFGVVTGMQIGLVPVARLYGGGLLFDGRYAADVLDAYRAWMPGLPEETTSSLALIPVPDLPRVPEPLRGRRVVHVRVAHLGPPEEGERLVAPLRAAGPRIVDQLGELDFAGSHAIYQDPTEPEPYRGTAVMLADLDGQAVRAALEAAGPDAPVPCLVELRHLGGALSRPPAVPNAVGHRAAPYVLRVLSSLHGVDAGVARQAHERLVGSLGGLALGRFLNFCYGPTTTEQVRSAYDAADYPRLAALKAAWDPRNTFRLNHNIPPAAGLGQG